MLRRCDILLEILPGGCVLGGKPVSHRTHAPLSCSKPDPETFGSRKKTRNRSANPQEAASTAETHHLGPTRGQQRVASIQAPKPYTTRSSRACDGCHQKVLMNILQRSRPRGYFWTFCKQNGMPPHRLAPQVSHQQVTPRQGAQMRPARPIFESEHACSAHTNQHCPLASPARSSGSDVFIIRSPGIHRNLPRSESTALSSEQAHTLRQLVQPTRR